MVGEIPASAVTIPKISLSSPPDGLRASLLEACRSAGFFYLSDHSIPSDLVEAVFQLSSDLFLNTTPESRAAYVDRANNVGYTPLQAERLDVGGSSDKTVAGDLKESFYVARLVAEAQEGEHKVPSQTLPKQLQNPGHELSHLVESCKAVCAQILQGFAAALELPQDYFSAQHHGAHDRLRLIHYPPAEVSSDSTSSLSIRAGSHTDYGSCTLLFQKDVGGLQVLLNDSWIDIPPKKGCLVVNIGDAMEFWTAGLFRSAQHRVVLPRAESEAGSRFSMAYFCQPDENSVLSPLPLPSSLAATIDAGAYERILAAKGVPPGTTRLTGGEHLRKRLEASYN